MSSSELLSISGLTISSRNTVLVHGIDLHIERGERVGLIGESGSGKSLTLLAAMGLLPENLGVSGSVRLAGEGELLEASPHRLASIRGSRISMVFQEPMTALNPLMRVGEQVAESLRLHQSLSSAVVRHRVLELLENVRIPEPARAARAYPHELSGGQRQRVMMAMAMANSPDLLLADEPTTALDVTVQKQVLDLMAEQVSQAGSSLLFITHDLAVVASICDRVLIMRHGHIVESGELDRVFSAPEHPYTRALLAASALETNPQTGRLITLESAQHQPAQHQPAQHQPVSGPSQSSATASKVIPAATVQPLLPHQRLHGHTTAGNDDAEGLLESEPPIFNQTHDSPLLAARDITRVYGKPGLFGGGRTVQALRGVSFDVRAGQRFGIVGESGCGKSTLLRILTGLSGATSGSATVQGREIIGTPEKRLRWLRETVQVVFQDPVGSLDPHMRIEDIVSEPLHRVFQGQRISRDERRSRVQELIQDVGLPRDALGRYPHEFSGGQRQRIAIARALMIRPKILVADEAVSALDVSVRAQILNLLDDLVDEYQLTMLFVSHDLHVVRHLCDTVAVMKAGQIVECGPAAALFEDPQHPYTSSLLESIPRMER